MRTITQIRESIEVEFMRSEALASRYGFTPGGEFRRHFSAASLESILIGIFAVAGWTLERLFDTYSADVSARIASSRPHRPKWYRDKALAFMKDKELVPDTDIYDTTGMSDEQIAAAHVVRHAVAVESPDSSILTIKLAGEDAAGIRQPLDAETMTQVEAYFREVKDAGVRLAFVNRAADRFDCSIDIYYNPVLTPAAVQAACQAAVTAYILNLPFNGEYTNVGLVDRLQQVEGVVIPELRSASAALSGSGAVNQINARYVPEAGYFEPCDVQLNMIPYA